FRLDELPQFVNILRGDINLVGPRPHPLSNFDLFTRTVPYYRIRSMVPPGVTGWAQVRYGYANDLEEETEKMRYDLYYIKHRSILLDALILLDTIKVVLLGRGAKVAEAARTESLARGSSVAFLPRMHGRHNQNRALARRCDRPPRSHEATTMVVARGRPFHPVSPARRRRRLPHGDRGLQRMAGGSAPPWAFRSLGDPGWRDRVVESGGFRIEWRTR